MTRVERTEKIRSSGTELLRERLLQNLEQIESDYEKNHELIVQDFMISINDLFHKAVILQEKSKKNDIQYFCCSFLRSSLYTKSYEFRLDLYSKDFYQDTVETTTYWSMDFMFQYLELDREIFLENIRTKVMFLQEHEERDFMTWYSTHYFILAKKFFADHVDLIRGMDEYMKVKKTDPLVFLYGGYMEKMSIL